jgi:DNA-directed RNA polymerase II subunit RPB1
LLKPTQDRKRYEPVQLKDPESFNRELTYGVIVERCLQDGDFVLFNRQPTLHRMSMMGHRVRILPYNTFRLNLSVCAPYNADFDGDEMNMHVPQNYETLAEIKHIAHVPRQIVTPKNNQPVMGMVQDALLGIFLFTLRDTFLTREEAMNLVIWIDSIEGKEDFEQLQLGELPMPAILKPVPLWTGKQIMSMIIPSKISMIQRKDKDDFWRNVKDSGMIIRRGELIMGALQKEIVGSGAGGLIHNIWLDIGPDATNYFLTTAQRIVNNWLTINSFSVGAADIVPTANCRHKISVEKEKTEKIYWELLNTLRSKEKIDASESILHHKEKTIMESFEVHLNQKLNDMLGICNKVVVEEISPYKNNIYKMIWAKSKGSETNLTQIVATLANQNVDGRRIPEGFTKRTLPHFCKDDRSPEPRGFVYSSFYTGLGPHEFFFHSMGGREGLSDTAVKTARTGYIQRKLIKALEDVIVKYDGTVRDSQNNLIQLMYGEDGFAAEYIEKQMVTLD